MVSLPRSYVAQPVTDAGGIRISSNIEKVIKKQMSLYAPMMG